MIPIQRNYFKNLKHNIKNELNKWIHCYVASMFNFAKYAVEIILLLEGKPNKQTKNYSFILHMLEVQTEIILETSELDTWLYTDLEA